MENKIDEYFVEEKSVFDKILDFLVFIAVFVVTIFLVLDVMASSGAIEIGELNSVYFWVDIVVFVIFMVDLIRLRIESTSWTQFFSNNWLDVLATIPFGLLAALASGSKISKVSTGILKLVRLPRLLSVVKMSKVAKVSKITKEFKAASHLKRESENYKKKHRL